MATRRRIAALLVDVAVHDFCAYCNGLKISFCSFEFQARGSQNATPIYPASAGLVANLGFRSPTPGRTSFSNRVQSCSRSEDLVCIHPQVKACKFPPGSYHARIRGPADGE